MDMYGRIALIVDLLDRALSGDVIVLAQHGGQTQFLQVMFQQQLRRVEGNIHSCAAFEPSAQGPTWGSE